MKNLKYLNAVLTVIAVCLVLITCSVIGIIPKANATTTPAHFATVPVNSDGSITVHLADDQIMKVDIEQCNGDAVGTKFGAYPIPVQNVTK
jgi:hypothetical protein